jgi:hypothetical protein
MLFRDNIFFKHTCYQVSPLVIPGNAGYPIYIYSIYLRTNSDLCHLQHKLIGFYIRDEKCLQRGTNWAFK